MDKIKLWEVTYSYTEIGWPPSEELECSKTLYIVAHSVTEAETKAKCHQEVKDRLCKFEAKEYVCPELSLPEDKEYFGLELIVRKL